MELATTTDRAKFTAPRDVRIVSDCGSMCVIFEAGETRLLPSPLYTAALVAGLIPEDPLEVAQEPLPENQTQEKKVSEGLIEACKTLIARGNPHDFTLVGQPRAASVKKLVDFDFTLKEVERAFSEAMHEVEQDGDESTKLTESSSSAAK